MYYIVVSYTPQECQRAKVYINGIYRNHQEAVKRQHEICGGNYRLSNLANNSVYGINGVISWMKTVEEGDLNTLDIYAPDTI